MRPLTKPSFYKSWYTWLIHLRLLGSASRDVLYVRQASRLWPCCQPASTRRDKLFPAPLCRAMASRGVLPQLSKDLLMRSSRRCRVPSRTRRVTEMSDGNLPQGDRAAEKHADCVAQQAQTDASRVPCAQEPLLGACYRQRNDSVYNYRAPSHAWPACASAHAYMRVAAWGGTGGSRQHACIPEVPGD